MTPSNVDGDSPSRSDRIEESKETPWFLPFSDAGDGRPWGDGTALAARAERGQPPWDSGCRVTPLIGGFEAMGAIRDSLEQAIAVARRSSLPAGRRGHVYLVAWRFDPLRDLSAANPWGTGPWRRPEGSQRVFDQSAIGLVLRLLQAGVRVRLLLWYPFVAGDVIGLRAHIEGHAYTARLVQAESRRLEEEVWRTPDAAALGVVGLDLRMPNRAACHHNKLLVIRVGQSDRGESVHQAYCGGMDLAFTRRDAPDAAHPYSEERPQFLGGDWQSGRPRPNGYGIPSARDMAPACWPRQQGVAAETVDYAGLDRVAHPILRQPPDIPEHLRRKTERVLYGPSPQIWHDQQLRLEGPVVATLEEHFRERWADAAARVGEVGKRKDADWSTNQILFTHPSAFDAEAGVVRPLPPAERVAPAGDALVQLWRTMPLRPRRAPPFRRGEFTLMAGVAGAIGRARHLIWIFDQYFWSLPLARWLNARLRVEPDLRVLLLLPPWSEKGNRFVGRREHRARALALNALVADDPAMGHSGEPVSARVSVYDLWDSEQNRGIYCHAKVQMYDDELMVCGSGNLNRRSFTCDTEVDCAVRSPELVRAHRRRLWSILFPRLPPDRTEPPVPPDFALGASSSTFFDAFRFAATRPGSFVVPDPWRDSHPRLPNGAPRSRHAWLGYRRTYDHLIDPTSIDRAIESGLCPHPGAPHGVGAPGRLDALVALLEDCRDPPAGGSQGHQATPFRRPPP